jgi:hypothetical protein
VNVNDVGKGGRLRNRGPTPLSQIQLVWDADDWHAPPFMPLNRAIIYADGHVE